MIGMSPSELSMRVTQFLRKPAPGFHSIERVFADVRSGLSPSVCVRVSTSRFESRGLFGRIFNVAEAAFRQGDVNHVTGDTHYLACCLSGRKTVLTIHDCVMMTRLLGLRRWIYWLFWLWIPVCRSAIVTVVSDAARKEVLGYVKCNPKKIRVVPNAVSSEFQPAPKAFNCREPVILQLGTAPNKNFENVVQALHGVSCVLCIVGHLTSSQQSLLDCHRINYVTHADLSRDEIVRLYVQCDIVMFASLYEGFGLPIIEANAVGRAVVTSSRHPMSDVAGDAACLVDPEDVESIRNGIAKIIGDAEYRRVLIDNGFRNAKVYALAEVAAQYEAIYREIAAGQGGAEIACGRQSGRESI